MNNNEIFQAVLKTANDISRKTQGVENRIYQKNVSLRAIRILLKHLGYTGCPLTLEDSYYNKFNSIEVTK